VTILIRKFELENNVQQLDKEVDDIVYCKHSLLYCCCISSIPV